MNNPKQFDHKKTAQCYEKGSFRTFSVTWEKEVGGRK